jgi:hypothetical protein
MNYLLGKPQASGATRYLYVEYVPEAHDTSQHFLFKTISLALGLSLVYRKEAIWHPE